MPVLNDEQLAQMKEDAKVSASKIAKELKSYKKKYESKVAKQEEWDLQKKFLELVERTTKLGKKINTFIPPKLKDPQTLVDHPQIFFAGFLEGDYSERALTSTPISLSGGFLLKVPEVGNFLFEPGMGTIKGLTELGVNLSDEIDAIIVSHYHPSACSECHTLFNILGKYTPNRAPHRDDGKKVFFFSTNAVIHGRNNHESILISSDRMRIKKSLFSSLGGESKKEFIISRGNNKELEVNEGSSNTRDRPYIKMTLLKAYHNEVVSLDEYEKAEKSVRKNEEVIDEGGRNGKQVSCFYLEVKNSKHDFSLLFTGDTEFNEKNMPEELKKFSVKPDILIANTKTLEYLTSGTPTGDDSWDNLKFTKNQLGWMGTIHLTQQCDPSLLVMRAFGLECIIKEDSHGNFVYAPENLSLIESAMKTILNQNPGEGNKKKEKSVIIPGRHILNIERNNGELKTTSEILVPSHPGYGQQEYGNDTKGIKYVTKNPVLIKQINRYLHILKASLKSPDMSDFLVILGESGSGKSHLGKALGQEIIKGSNFSVSDVRTFDLAAISENLYESQIFGHVEGAFTGAVTDSPGILEEKGVVVLNQLEKLPMDKAKKFLDVLEEWKHHKLGGVGAINTKPILIFTCNREIEECENLSADLRNRLLGRCIRIPSLSELSEEERERDISVYINHWCETNKCTLEISAISLLLKDIDLTEGELRALRNILNKAKELVEMNLGAILGEKLTYLHITEDFIKQACKENHITIKKAKKTEEISSTETNFSIEKELRSFLDIIILLSKKGSATYICEFFRTDQSTKKVKGLSPTKLKKRLQIFKLTPMEKDTLITKFRLARYDLKAVLKLSLKDYFDSVIPHSKDEIADFNDFLKRNYVIDKNKQLNLDDLDYEIWMKNRKKALNEVLSDPQILESTIDKIMSIMKVS